MSKILLVEDDNNLREIYEARLQAEGFNIISAHDGEEALVIAKNEQPDLIISDVMMPKISGFEMLDIIRNTPTLNNVKVIMLTALGQNDDQDRAGKLGANKYLIKSQVTLEDIVNAAHELLDNPSNNNQTQLSTTAPLQPNQNTIIEPTTSDQPDPISTPKEEETTAINPTINTDSTISYPNTDTAPEQASIPDPSQSTIDPTTSTNDTQQPDSETSNPDQNNQQLIDQAVNTLNNQTPNDNQSTTSVNLPHMQNTADEFNNIQNQINDFVSQPNQNTIIEPTTSDQPDPISTPKEEETTAINPTDIKSPATQDSFDVTDLHNISL